MIDAEIVVEQLQLAFERSNGQVENFQTLLRAAENEVQAARDAVAKLTETNEELVETSFDKFFRELIEGAREASDEQVNITLAVQKLRAQLEAGLISIDTFANAMDALGQGTKEVNEEIEKQATVLSGVEQFYNNLIESAAKTANEFEYATEAQRRLNEDLVAGRISIDDYAIANERLRDILNQTSEEALTYADYVENVRERVEATMQQDQFKAQLLEELRLKFGDAANATGEYAAFLRELGFEADTTTSKLDQLRSASESAVESAERRIALARERAELSGIADKELRQLKAIELEELRLAEAAKERIRAQFEGVDNAELERQLRAIDEATENAIRQRQTSAQTIAENTERIRQQQENQRK